ncbi:hypothetical protein EIP86_007014 [Pleurotus ostreatoroseus]|nr:hypothetical protein EIP86_007014 [Pleurotus ostreatoroseus]
MFDQIHAAVAQVVAAAPRASLAALKLVVFALFLVNARSWPLLWHWRVLVRPILDIRLPYYRFLLSTAFLPAHVRVQKKAEWLARLCPVGEDPIAFEVREPAWAGPDDCDFNWHLSNSCYPKVRLSVFLSPVPSSVAQRYLRASDPY